MSVTSVVIKTVKKGVSKGAGEKKGLQERGVGVEGAGFAY